MIPEQLASLPLFAWSAVAFVGSRLVGILAQLGSPADSMVDKYIERGGTVLTIFLLICAIVHLVREKRDTADKMGKLIEGRDARIEALHAAQIEEAKRSTEARIAQSAATEGTNKATSELAAAVAKLADKVQS